MTDGWIIALVAAALIGITTAPFLVIARRRERRTEASAERAKRYGFDEPATLHPVVDPAGCIGTGSCLSVCPEDEVIGFRNGQAVVVAPARCIGHGLCERACPVDAIRLVFGTATRGVEIPRIRENFETNVAGVYIIGELGGMGLIRNAFEQARQCVDAILREPAAARSEDLLDAVIVGCGPAGLAASLHCQHAGLRFVTLEKEPDIGGTVRHYPRKKVVMTAPVQVPGYGTIASREVSKEDLIGVWATVVQHSGIEVTTGATVERIEPRGPREFDVVTAAATYRTRRVILAIGRRGIPRKLGVPGEEAASVFYSLLEPEAFTGDRALVVGGGDSAVEAALALADQRDTVVRLSYRKDRFARIKPANLRRIEHALDTGLVTVLWSTEISAFEPRAVRYRDPDGTETLIDNDHTFVFIGGELPTRFLRDCGVAIDTKFGTP